MQLFSVPLSEHLDVSEYFLNLIQEQWERRGQDKDIRPALREKIQLCSTGKVDGKILVQGQEPVGIFWMEKNTQTYGSIVFFASHSIYQQALVDSAVQSGYFNDRLLELVDVEDTDAYRKCLEQAGLNKNSRKRMCCWLDKAKRFDEEEHDYTFSPFLKEHVAQTAQISFDAHKVSKDYELYPDLTNLEKRTVLEERVYNGLYGQLVQPASMVVWHQGELIASCMMIEVSCWGFEKVPWIFDIVVTPKKIGQGVGRILLKKALNACIDEDYPAVGLAVTLSNKYAIRLYHRLGFQDVDIFYE